MRNTLQEQYNLLKEGKMNKQHFFKSARHLFPDLITPTNSFTDAVTILKNRGIISEGIGGLVTTGKKQDWHAIFNENMTTLKEEKEAKAEEKETTKEVTDMATRGYDYKDEKNYDNVFGQEFLQGYYTEMKDPKNADKHVDELRAIVAKNLAKDCNYYVKNGQFGVKGLGYTTEAPSLGEPKEAKGKYKSSGYGDLKESVLRLAIQDIIKEIIEEEVKYATWTKNNQPVKVLKRKIVFDIEDGDGKTYTVDIDQLTSKDPNNPITEALDMESIKLEGEDAKKKVMERRITNEIVKRKKQIKALETLTELDREESGDSAKKVKELQSEIKKLKGAKAKLHKVKEMKYAGPESADDLAKDPNLNKVKNPLDKKSLINTVKQGGAVEL